MNRYFRFALIVVVVVQIGFAAGYLFQVRALTRLWPLPYTNALSFAFIASITLAAAAATLWCVMVDDGAALAGIALDSVAIFVPVSVFVFQLAGRSANSALTVFGGLCVLMVAVGLGLLVWSLRQPVRDRRPVPRLVRASFVVFVIALLIAGSQMVQRSTRIMPWQISPDATVIYGWMFLGAAAYFAYGALRPGWFNAGGQLAGFLAYDVVLIVPFLQRLPAISPDLLPNLIIYIGVLVYSGALATYYLFIHPATRLRLRSSRSLETP